MALKDQLAKLRRSKGKDLSPAQQRRRMIIGLSFRAILLFMMAAAILYAIVSSVIGSNLFIPRSADAVLDSVEQPSSYLWGSELTRKYDLAGVPGYYENYRSVAVNTDLNRMQIVFSDVFQNKGQAAGDMLVSDGKAARILYYRDEGNENDNWLLINDACGVTDSPNDKDPPSAELATLPTAEEIKQSDPEIVSDKATYRKDRAWLLSFTPSAQVIARLMLIELSDIFADRVSLERNGRILPSDRQYILSDEERQAIEDGKYKPLEGGALVTRDDRELVSVYVHFKVKTDNGTSDYKLLGQIIKPLGPAADDIILESLSQSATDCADVRAAAGVG